MTALMAVFWKEFADHLFSKRFLVFLLIMYAAGVATIYVAADTIRQSVSSASGTQFIFLRLFVLQGESLPFSFPSFLSLFIPILGIALGFDAINNERSSGNLSRLLAQPVYRDSVINGKFLAGLATIFILVTSVFLIVGGLGLRMIGVPPTAEEILRLFGFIFITIVYGGFWLALSILFSVLLKKGTTALISALAIWLFVTIFIPLIATGIANAIASPITQQSTVDQYIKWYSIYDPITYIAPSTLYGGTVQSLLLPDLNNVSALLMLQGGIDYASNLLPLPLVESLINVWPQIIALIALSVICFAISYVKFQREEVRST
jgi:ABC-2 type transport system permease protein